MQTPEERRKAAKRRMKRAASSARQAALKRGTNPDAASSEARKAGRAALRRYLRTHGGTGE